MKEIWDRIAGLRSNNRLQRAALRSAAEPGRYRTYGARVVDDSDRASEVRRFILGNWPKLLTYFPQVSTYLRVSLNTGLAKGLCSHPDVIDRWWVHSRGGKRFIQSSYPPESFFWAGVQDRGGSEYLFLMWHREGRRYWFYDQYLVTCATTEASIERTATRITTTLDRWQMTNADVIYSGLWGWFDPGSHHFESDTETRDCEDWEIFA